MLTDIEFLDREDETSILLNFLYRLATCPEVCILHARSGIGKSSLTQQATGQVAAPVVLRVAPLNHASAAGESFYYLGLFAQAMAKAQANAGLGRSFADFLQSQQRGSITEAFWGDLHDIAKKFYIPVQTAKAFSTKLRKSSNAQVPSIHGRLRGEVDIIYDYLTFALDGAGYVITMENIQVIDVKSYEALLFLLERGYAHKWILEYTDPGIGMHDQLRSVERTTLVRNCREAGASVASMQLDRLPAKYVANLLEKSGDPTQIVLNSYLESDGNLRPLVDFDIHLLTQDQCTLSLQSEDTQIINLSVITERKVEQLPVPEKSLLIVIHILDGLCEQATLRELLSQSSGPLTLVDFESSLDKLCSQKLVRLEGKQVRIAHDQVSDAIVHLPNQSGLMLSTKTEVGRYLEDNLHNPGLGTNVPQTATKLCDLYLDTGETERVLKLLQMITPDLVATGRTDRLIELLLDVEALLAERHLPEPFYHHFFRLLLDIYYHAGKHSDALRCVGRLPHSQNRTLLTAALYDLTGQHDKGLKIAKDLLSNPVPLDTESVISARLVQVTSLRSLNRHEECERCYSALLNDKSIQQHSDYPLVLRGAEMALPFTLAAPLLDRAMDELEAQNRKLEAGRAAVIAAFVHTILEAYDHALDSLHAAYRLLDGTVSERQSLLNNHLALLIYQGDCGEAAEGMLRMARLSAQPHYHRLVLYNNTMIFYAMRQDKTAAYRSAQVLANFLELTDISDKDIRRIVHFNLSRFWSSEDPGKSAHHLQQSKDNQISYLHDTWIQRWQDNNWTNSKYRGEGQLPFIPTFLSYWAVDISKLVAKCQ